MMLSSKQRRVLLVDGYIREQEILLSLSNIIPTSIYSIIFEFQLLVETWNKEYSSSNAIVSDDGSCIDIANDAFCCNFGSHIVKYGDCFQWTLKVVKYGGRECFKCAIGLIPDKNDLLTIKNENAMRKWPQKGGYMFSAVNGCIQFGNENNAYCKEENVFGNEGDILQIKFNGKESTLHFITNGNDLGNCLVTWKGEKVEISNNEQLEYRLGICVKCANGAKIMIEGEEF